MTATPRSVSPCSIAATRPGSASRPLFSKIFFVEEKYRGRGAGLALIRGLAGIARERGYSRLEWRVLDWNEPAHRFYRSIGASPIDEWTVWRVEGDALERLAIDRA